MTEIVDVATGEVTEEPDSAMMVVPGGAVQAPARVEPEHPITLPAVVLTKEQQDAVTRPLEPELVEFRWGDKAKTFALVYASWVECAKRLDEMFGPMGWRHLPLGKPTLVDSVIAQNTGLYVNSGQGQGQMVLVATGLGEQDWIPQNGNMTYPTAIESATSNGLSRCCKHFGLFRELWDKKSTRYKDAEAAWLKANRFKCPECGEYKAVMKSKYDDGYYCFQKIGGCGAKGFQRPDDDEGGGDQPKAEAKPRATETPGPKPPPPAPASKLKPKPKPTPQDDAPKNATNQAFQKLWIAVNEWDAKLAQKILERVTTANSERVTGDACVYMQTFLGKQQTLKPKAEEVDDLDFLAQP